MFRLNQHIYTFLTIIFAWVSLIPNLAFSQGTFHKFPITKEGVYKITSAQALQIGAKSIHEIKILGNQGVLDQKLNSSSLKLQEIPVKIIGDEMFFYLSGPHYHTWNENKFEYNHHPYTDTLYYLIQTGQASHKLIEPNTEVQPAQNTEARFLYSFHTKKEEFFNILNSGRAWYGNRTFNGQRVNFFFPPSLENAPVYYSYKVMGQSTAESQFIFQLNDQEVIRTHVPSIPESTYGIKGREVMSSGWFDLGPNNGSKASFTYTTSNSNGAGYINHFTLGIPTAAEKLNNGIFHNLSLGSFSLPNNGNLYWGISVDGSVQEATSGHLNYPKIAVFTPAATLSIAGISPADLSLRHAAVNSELLIITNSTLKAQAEKLAAHRTNMGISASVVLVEDIYNAYGYGNRDVTAIRNFVAAQYHGGGKIKNLLLFGKGTYDYKFLAGGRPNIVPIYTSKGSLNPLATYSSDDYYAFLEWGDGEWMEENAGDHSLSIGVGRIPAINPFEAASVVEKLIAYDHLESNLGDWKRKVLLFADDGDNHLHLNDSEKHAAVIHQKHPELVMEKLYLDAFPQIMENERQRSPKAQSKLLEQVREGILLINYVGHGNETTLTSEQVFTTSQLADWPERKSLPVLVTATCEFGRHDSPFSRSGAEDMLTLRGKGAIALLTTGRPVFSSANFALNKAFFDIAFSKEDGTYLTLGEIYKFTKNNSTNGVLNRSFALLGDPSMRMALPDLEAQAEELSEVDLNITIDTLKANQRVVITGRISDPLTQSTISGFNGEYLITITDKPTIKHTLGNESQTTSYLDENSDIFRGTGKVVSGRFSLDAYIPGNIQEEVGMGSIKLFALDKSGKEAIGAKILSVGGKTPPNPTDKKGPLIRMMVQDSTKVVTKISSTTTPFFAFLEDESGININSTSLDQQLVLNINGENQISLNKSYIALDGGYRRGQISTMITGLREGKNILTLTASDNLGNVSTQSQEVMVEGSLRLSIIDYMTYPNPATEFSRFRLTHNRPGENLSLSIRIFNILGSEIFSFTRRFPNAVAILDDVEWIFLQSKTKYPAKGTYIYELVIQSEADGSTDRKSGKLLIQ